MYEYKATLVKVVDGDTVDVVMDLGFKIMYKQRIRLAGIDTPESRTRDLNEKSWGLAAKYRLIELLAQNDDFIVRTQIDKKGKFGRVLGELIVNDINLNHQLVLEKLAIPYEGGNKEETRRKYGVLKLWSKKYDSI